MDPSKMKVVDLRSELGALGLDTKGNKAALVERLKKALEAKTGKVFADTSVLDTTTEDVEEPATPRRPGPAARTTRRSSSSRLASTPAKQLREEPPVPIDENVKEEMEEIKNLEAETSPKSIEISPKITETTPKITETTPKITETTPKITETERTPDIAAITPKEDSPKKPEADQKPEKDDSMDVYCVEGHAKSPIMVEDDAGDQDETSQIQDDFTPVNNEVEEKVGEEKDTEKMDHDGEDNVEEADKENSGDSDQRGDNDRELTEEEEWELLNERLKIREQERIEREKRQEEEDAKKFEEMSKDPIKLQRLQRKQEKKARWSNFYRTIADTNEVLMLPVEEGTKHKKTETVVTKIPEPEINDNKITLSWYDSDLNQYLEIPELNSVVPMTEGALAHAWAGARASHGVNEGRVCFEVRVGAVVTTTESSEKEVIGNGLRIGWSTDDSTLHLGEGELSWGFESTGRAVNNGEFKEYGKQFAEKDVIGAYIDLESNPCKISYTLNGIELGAAYEFTKESLGDRAVFPHVLTKNICYKVNMGYDRYNMLTRTKLVRNCVEIPIEQIIEEKKAHVAEIKRQKQEAIRRNRERREKEKKEREERQRKKKEERERIARERKEKEAQERRERGEEDPEEMEHDNQDTEKQATDAESQPAGDDQPTTEDQSAGEGQPAVEDQLAGESQSAAEGQPIDEGQSVAEEPKENGENDVKPEPMETDRPQEPKVDDKEKEQEAAVEKEGEKELASVKEEPVNEGGDAKESTEDDLLKGRLLDKRVKNVIRYVVEEELDGTEACLVPGYVLIGDAALLLPGPRAPAAVADCEVILMVGMPGSGKTYWAKQHTASHPEKRYNILSTGALFDKMKVDCKPFRTSYEGRWDAMVTKCAKCVLKLLEIAKGRKRNFILDQTNVYPSAQRRKLREFDGYRRLAVVIVTDEETYKERQKRREEADGKEVPDGAIVDMKANFTLPEKGAWLDDVIYPELNEEEAKKIIEAFHKEAKAAGVVKEREKRDRSASRDGPPSKRSRDSDKRHARDDRRQRDFGRDREDRWGGGGRGGGGGGGTGRWGPAARGGRWGGGGGGGGGGRDRGGPHGMQGRFDRQWGMQHNRNDFGGRNDHRDNFRGGRGGGNHGPGGMGGHGGPGGPGMRGDRGRGPPGLNDGSRFNRDNRQSGRGLSQDKRQGPGGNGGSGGGMGSWQRGGAPTQQGNNRGPPRGPGGGPPGIQGAQGAPGSQSMRSNNKDLSNQNQNQNQNQNSQNANQAGWNQWATNWGGWGNWNQNQGWGGWGNWGWGNPQGGGGNQSGSGGQSQSSGGKSNQGQNQNQNQNQQWSNNYTAQQWYQWQQWQQQQQGWPGYQQSQGNQQSGNVDPQAWAQYYQNYGGANSAAVTGVPPPGDKK